jgi:hypothetical protein
MAKSYFALTSFMICGDAPPVRPCLRKILASAHGAAPERLEALRHLGPHRMCV